MTLPTKNISEKKQTLIFIFIQNIPKKNMQDLVFFLKKNNFDMKRITKKNNNRVLTSNFVNSNFILNSKQNICAYQLKDILKFLTQHSKIHGVFFKNQIWSFERLNQIETNFWFNFWKKITNWIL